VYEERGMVNDAIMVDHKVEKYRGEFIDHTDKIR